MTKQKDCKTKTWRFLMLLILSVSLLLLLVACTPPADEDGDTGSSSPQDIDPAPPAHEVSEAVYAKAEELVADWFVASQAAEPKLQLQDWQIDEIRHIDVYEEIEGHKLHVYRLEYSYSSAYSSEESLGTIGIYVIEQGLVWSGDKKYVELVYDEQEGEQEFLIAMKAVGSDKAAYLQQAVNLAEQGETFFDMTKQPIEVADSVMSAAENLVAEYLAARADDAAAYQDSRITYLTHVYTYEDFEGQVLQIYQMNYEFYSASPENAAIAGGMYITNDCWVMPSYPYCTFLVFAQDGADQSLNFLVAMMENDCAPGDEMFSDDLLQRLSELPSAE